MVDEELDAWRRDRDKLLEREVNALEALVTILGGWDRIYRTQGGGTIHQANVVATVFSGDRPR